MYKETSQCKHCHNEKRQKEGLIVKSLMRRERARRQLFVDTGKRQVQSSRGQHEREGRSLGLCLTLARKLRARKKGGHDGKLQEKTRGEWQILKGSGRGQPRGLSIALSEKRLRGPTRSHASRWWAANLCQEKATTICEQAGNVRQKHDRFQTIEEQ